MRHSESKIDYNLGHKTYLNRFLRIETIQSMLVDCNENKQINNTYLEKLKISEDSTTYFKITHGSKKKSHTNF